MRLPFAQGLSRSARSWPITPVGWTVLAVVLVSVPVGAATGWVEWWAVAVAGVVVLGAGLLQSMGSFSYRMDLDVDRRRVVVGGRGRIEVRVINTARRRLWPVTMEVAVADGVTTATVPMLPPGGFADLVLPVPTDRRAVLTIGPVRAVRRDVLGTVRREVQWPLSEKVYVHPRTVRTDGALAGFVRDLDGEESMVRAADDLSFHSLREYVPGDDRRHIHWKKTARAGSLLVREFLETRRSLVVLVLPTDPADHADAAEFELAVSVTASMMLGLLRDGRTVATQAGSTLIRASNPGAVLDQFSAVLPDDKGGLAATSRLAVQRFPQLSLLVPVFGSPVSGGTARAVFRLRPGGASVQGLRVQPSAAVSGGSGDLVAVPDLAALPLVLREARR